MDQQELIEQIMNGLRNEVEQLVQGTEFKEETLEQTEERSRQFAQRCGTVGFGVVIGATLAAQNHGHVGQDIVTEAGTATFERYEERWVLTHLGRFRICRAYYWNSQAQSGTLPLDEWWDLDGREPSPALGNCRKI